MSVCKIQSPKIFLSENTLKAYVYDRGLIDGQFIYGGNSIVEYTPSRWVPLYNADTNFLAQYPLGCLITTDIVIPVAPYPSLDGVALEVYLSPDRQSLLQYADDTHYIYTRSELKDPENGVQKRIKITQIPTSHAPEDMPPGFTGAVGAAIYVTSFFTNERIAYAEIGTLYPEMTFEPKMEGGKPWTGTGNYRISLEIQAALYGTRVFQRGMSTKEYTVISGEEVIIPFTREYWDFWTLSYFEDNPLPSGNAQ